MPQCKPHTFHVLKYIYSKISRIEHLKDVQTSNRENNFLIPFLPISLLTHLFLRVHPGIAVWIDGSFDDNFGIENDLKESCW